MHEKFKSLCQREALPKIASLSYSLANRRRRVDVDTRRAIQSLSKAEQRMNVSTQQSSHSDACADALTAVLPSQRTLYGIMTAICGWLLNAN